VAEKARVAGASGAAGEAEPPALLSSPRTEISEELIKAEPESVEETFDDNQIEISEEEDEAEVIEELDAVEVVESPIDPLELDDLPESIEPELVGPADLQATFADPVLAGPLPASTRPPSGGRSPVGPNGRPAARMAPEQLDADDDLLFDEGPETALLGNEFDDIDLDPDAELPEIEPLEIDPDVEFGPGPARRDGPGAGRPTAGPKLVPSRASDDELMSFDELDAVDLGDGEMAAASNDPYVGGDATLDADDNPEMVGAIRFNDAETALGTGDHARAVALLEEAYDNGFDVAELHAMLAYARFMASGGDLETAQHAFELLEYAQQMDPSLDLVHAYRGAIHKALGQTAPAREALERALELNPYCELAIQLLDQL
jgi:hypothetical protein